MEVLLIGNDQTLTVTGIRDEITDAYINDAAVTAIVKNPDGTEVSGQDWPLTLAYVTSSNGNYAGNLEDTLELVPLRPYIIEITIDAGGGRVAKFRLTRNAIDRTA